MRPNVCFRNLLRLLRTSVTGLDLLYILLYCLNVTYKVLPLRVQVGLVGQAALHDIGAVVGAGFDRGQAATVRAVNQLHQGLHTFWTQRNLVWVDRKGRIVRRLHSCIRCLLWWFQESSSKLCFVKWLISSSCFLLSRDFIVLHEGHTELKQNTNISRKIHNSRGCC